MKGQVLGQGGIPRQGNNQNTQVTRSGTTLRLRAPAGVYDGVDDTVDVTDANYIAGNIKNNVTFPGNLVGTLTIAGLDHTAGSDLLASADYPRSANAPGSYTKLKEMRINKKGTYRVRFNSYHNAGVTPYTMLARIYKNGVAYGTPRTVTGTDTMFSENLAFDVNDLVQVYVASDSGSYMITVSNFRLLVANISPPTVTLD